MNEREIQRDRIVDLMVDPWRVACPHCQAPPWTSCTMGWDREDSHRLRQAEALLAAGFREVAT